MRRINRTITITNTTTQVTIRTVTAITLMTYMAMKPRSSSAILIGLSIGTSIVLSSASQ